MCKNNSQSIHWEPEIINRPNDFHKFKAVLFDFDGTLSLIRAGWQEVMLPYFCEEFFDSLPQYKNDEASITEMIRDFIDRLTGKQTIFQCKQLKDEIEKRGGKAKEAMDYKNEYIRRLLMKIESTKKGLADKSLDPLLFIVNGAADFLEMLKNHGLELYCASGTDQPQVRQEARLLGLDRFFGENIYGALDEHAEQCSKEVVIKNLLDSNGIKGEELLSFGDGFVEIELVKNVGGFAVAVATDEIHKSGVDEDKRLRLLSAGADAVIPDFGEFNKVFEFLFNKGA